MFKTIARNVFSNYVGIGGTIVIAFLLSPFLVNTLGDTNYGIWSVISALTGYMTLLDLGVSSAVLRFVSRYSALNDYKSINKVIATGLAITITVGTLLVLSSPLLASLLIKIPGIEENLQDTLQTFLLIASIDICIFIITGILLSTMTGFQRYDVANAINLGVALFKATAFYFALTNGFGLFAMAVISLCGSGLAAISSIFVLKKIQPRVEFKPIKAERSTFVSIFHFSKFTFISMLAMQLVYYSDAFVIGYFMGAAAITYYTIPWSLSEYSNKLIIAIARPFVPVISGQSATNGNEAIYETCVTGTKFLLYVSNLLCVGMLIVGYNFLAIWMGPSYAEKCFILLIIMFITQMIKGPQLILHSMLVATSRQQAFSLLNFAFSVLNLGLSIIFIQRFELVGVAVATAFTQIVFYGIVTPILAGKVLQTKLWPYYRDTAVRSIPSTLTLAVILYYISEQREPDGFIILFTQAFLSAAAYSIAAFYTLLSKTERKFVLSKANNYFMILKNT